MPTTKPGYLTKKTYFPQKGDVLSTEDSSLRYECARVCHLTDSSTETVAKVALIWVKCPSVCAPGIIAWPKSGPLVGEAMDEVHLIRRPSGKGSFVEYQKNPATGVFQEITAG